MLSWRGKHKIAKMKSSLVIEYGRKLTIGVSFVVSVKMKWVRGSGLSLSVAFSYLNSIGVSSWIQLAKFGLLIARTLSKGNKRLLFMILCNNLQYLVFAYSSSYEQIRISERNEAQFVPTGMSMTCCKMMHPSSTNK